MEKLGPKETIIYGGAFNPPTRAHQSILQACIDYAEPRSADVWLLPSASRMDKTIEVTRAKRLAYCRALAQDIVCRTVSIDIVTLELDARSLTETYTTVQQLALEYPNRDFTWVFGADSVATMEQWTYGEWLRDNLNMLVVERPGYTAQTLGARAARLVVDAGDMSSTELRRRMAAGEPYEELVAPSVARILSDDEDEVIC